MNEKFQNKDKEPIFPPESYLVIDKILEKYGLSEIHQQGIDKISRITDPQEVIDIFENLPGTKIARAVKNYAEGKIKLEDIPLLLEKELNISSKEAEQMVEDLKKTVLDFIKWEMAKEENIVTEGISKAQKEEKTTAKKPENFSSKDIYREPIE
jgi:hypothetical protein